MPVLICNRKDKNLKFKTSSINYFKKFRLTAQYVTCKHMQTGFTQQTAVEEFEWTLGK